MGNNPNGIETQAFDDDFGGETQYGGETQAMDAAFSSDAPMPRPNPPVAAAAAIQPKPAPAPMPTSSFKKDERPRNRIGFDALYNTIPCSPPPMVEGPRPGSRSIVHVQHPVQQSVPLTEFLCGYRYTSGLPGYRNRNRNMNVI